MVATADQDAEADPQAADFPEATRRSRTGDLLITKPDQGKTESNQDELSRQETEDSD
jgi:hypothetical protein